MIVFRKDHKMALMQLGDCEEAIDALIKSVPSFLSSL